VILGDDFTVRGGASDASIAGKMLMAEQMANEYGMPIVRMIDGTGGGGSVKSLETNPRTYIPTTPAWEWLVANMQRAPVVSLALGPCAGTWRWARRRQPFLGDGERDFRQVFVAGPPVAKAIGEMSTRKGSAAGRSMAQWRGRQCGQLRTRGLRAGASLPVLHAANSSEAPPVTRADGRSEAAEDFLLDIVPKDGKTPYMPRKIIEAVVDKGSFFEIGALWGRQVVTGLARIDGHPVAIIAGDPFFLDGAWTSDACDKVVRHIDLALPSTCRHPLRRLPRLRGGREARETSGVTRKGVRAMAAIYQAQTPILPVVIRKAYGLAGSVMFNPTKTRWRYCWPSGDWGSCRWRAASRRLTSASWKQPKIPKRS
jgi:acetyl-CoA carboxylase carboxyltransferase component